MPQGQSKEELRSQAEPWRHLQACSGHMQKSTLKDFANFCGCTGETKGMLGLPAPV